jgi:hypothetical protein
MLPMTFSDKTAALLGAFTSRFAIGVCDLRDAIRNHADL